MTSGLSPPSGVDRAIVALSGPSNVTGTVYFSQTLGRGPVTVRGEIKGLDPNALRGFHVHQSGDLSNGCVAANAHFNPYNKPHGASTDKDRHVGDLGNIRSNADGIASFTFNDAQISLNGPLSIIG
ncbi:hypothetical protein DXG03_004908 [Asterophora parasitica]|uniref:Superoxide dismutase copper/zinc binding domain-containing protein n=1 Tax=Asterophora parasitica TaxID=117018 RepID=A0A9P7GE92_9AGAR|nr:hypothetical protein DXG03_004908 [Asterophora parasitica]